MKIICSDGKELAKYLQYLNSNDTAYNEYLQWKIDGPSKEWIALVDLSILHSECRFCIRSADLDRYRKIFNLKIFKFPAKIEYYYCKKTL
jgi:hypothetical protein